MDTHTSPCSCSCTTHLTRRRSMLRKILALRKPTIKRTRSGRCSECKTAPHREGQVIDQLPKDVEQLAGRTHPRQDVRGYDAGDIACRLAVISMVARFTNGLEHEEEVDLSERVYTQLKMEGSPLVDMRWMGGLDDLPDWVFEHLHTVMKNQLGSSYNGYDEPNEE
ncbi:hypothetical protein F5Y00DRAFT_236401 [Daldinia vernicosa]|uniref:uncharacterized protein n=1 Tax=Daldinia vernicosa TaxID=114800 RepID=UPI0020084D4A|nr:uncharacterized protein F5Y00DRAFT_236401 [Daldinia vernicosa]KAI0849028.1 hypothetical protein F5Y00DRAFT_236401 [Daldinia vernicosa]